MPSFFLRNKGNQKFGDKLTKKTVSHQPTAQTPKRKRLSNVDVSSDDDFMDVVDRPLVVEKSDDEQYEDVHETAYRKAKQLLTDIQRVEEVENQDGDWVADRLKDDAFSKVTTHHVEVAETVRLGDSVVQYRAHRYSTVAVAMSHDGRFVVSCSKDATVTKYDLEEGKKVATIKHQKDNEKSHQGHVNCLAISANDKYLVTGGTDSVIRIWNFADLQHVKNLNGHRNSVTGLAFRIGSMQLFSCSADRSIKIWDLDQMGYADTLFGHVDTVVAIDVLTKELVVTAGAQDRTVRLWKVAEESHLIFNGFATSISIDCVAMINEGHFVSGSANGELCIWSRFKKKPVCVQREAHGKGADGQANWIVSVAARPYTDLCVSGSCDGFIRLWKVSEDYKSVLNILSYQQIGFINCLRFADDGEEIVCAVGQEHKLGRWSKINNSKNIITVLSLTYSTTL